MESSSEDGQADGQSADNSVFLKNLKYAKKESVKVRGKFFRYFLNFLQKILKVMDWNVCSFFPLPKPTIPFSSAKNHPV
jgi:hypothetical protein